MLKYWKGSNKISIVVISKGSNEYGEEEKTQRLEAMERYEDKEINEKERKEMSLSERYEEDER